MHFNHHKVKIIQNENEIFKKNSMIMRGIYKLKNCYLNFETTEKEKNYFRLNSTESKNLNLLTAVYKNYYSSVGKIINTTNNEKYFIVKFIKGDEINYYLFNLEKLETVLKITTKYNSDSSIEIKNCLSEIKNLIMEYSTKVDDIEAFISKMRIQELKLMITSKGESNGRG